jgi:hypothetical protein
MTVTSAAGLYSILSVTGRIRSTLKARNSKLHFFSEFIGRQFLNLEEFGCPSSNNFQPSVNFPTSDTEPEMLIRSIIS